MEAVRTSAEETYETFAIKGPKGTYQATHRPKSYRSNRWRIANKFGQDIDPYGRLGRAIIAACQRPQP